MAFLTGFGKRKELRYGTVFPDANLTDFPKLFSIASDSDIAAELAGGGGIAVTASDGETPVPFGLYPSSDLSSGDLLLRAKFSPLTAATTGDVMGYVYYDSAQSTTEDKAGVVSNGYVLFMPLEEDPSGVAPQIYDWVTESTVGTSTGSMASGDLVDGVVGKGLDFDGSNDSVAVNSSLVGSGDFTMEHHVRLNNTTSCVTLGEGRSSSNNPLAIFQANENASNKFKVAWRNDSNSGAVNAQVVDTSATPNDGSFHHWAATRSTNTLSLYRDGSPLGTDAGATGTATFDRRSIGALTRGTTSLFANAVVDEVRISSVARSAAWIEYAYVDDFDNADTFSLGPEETDGGGGGFQAAWAAGCNVLIGGCVS